MIVMKFGGTSVGSAAQIQKVSEIIGDNLGKKPLIVVSALSGVTNGLICMIESALSKGVTDISELVARHHEVIQSLNLPHDLLKEELGELETLFKGILILKECSFKTRDRILAFGEHCSAKIVSHFLDQKLKTTVSAICSYDLGLRTDSQFGKATPLLTSYPVIKKIVAEHPNDLIVTTGFIAKDEGGNITTLGRNGSDYSAALIGAALDAEEIQIWTDVSGILTTDPRYVKEAKPVSQMSFDEAAELAYYGAKVIHPSTILPAMEKNIPVRILNTNEPEATGTVIYSDRHKSQGSVKSIAHRSGLTIIDVKSTRMLAQHGFLAKIFEIFAKNKIVVDMVSTSEISVSLTVEHGQNLAPVTKELQTFSQVTLNEGQAIVSVVGEGVRDDHSVTARVFSTLNHSQIPVRMISLGASAINLSFLIAEEDVKEAVQQLHQEFFSFH